MDPVLHAADAQVAADAAAAAANNLESTGTPVTDTQPHGSSQDKENVTAGGGGGKIGLKTSSFDVEKAVRNAKEKLKSVAPKRGFEDMFMYAVR